MQPQTGNSRPPCRTCNGNCTIKIQAHNKDKRGTTVEEKVVQCPACRGSGKSGYVTK